VAFVRFSSTKLLLLLQLLYFQIILSNALEDKSFNLKHINILNDMLEYIYLSLTVMCFLLSLGNRPQGFVLPSAVEKALLIMM
jgi:hypothetical protein